MVFASSRACFSPGARFVERAPQALPSTRPLAAAILPSLCLWIPVQPPTIGAVGKTTPGESLALPFFWQKSGRNVEMSLPRDSRLQLSRGCWAYLSQPGSVRSRPAFPSAPPPACACVCARKRRRGANYPDSDTSGVRVSFKPPPTCPIVCLEPVFPPPRPAAHPRFSLRSKSAFPPLGSALFSWVGSCVDLPPGPRGII